VSKLTPALSHRGQEIARLFRQSRGLLDTRACDLEAIVDEEELTVANSRSGDPGYAAVLVRLAEGGGGIMLAANQSPGRRRFSLAHELGHYFIPSHAKQGATLKCADADLRARSTDTKTLEWEANDFASELLMAQRLFENDSRHLPVSFETVEHLARDGMYNVSRTAAAWRLVQVSAEQCALVMTTDGSITWVARSRSFAHWIPERGQAIAKGCVAAAVYRGESPATAAESVDPSDWLDGNGPFEGIELFESTHAIPSQRQILSLIWVRNRDDYDYDD
jgi:hypothetical protein